MLFLKGYSGYFEVSVDLSTGSDSLDKQLASRIDDFFDVIGDTYSPAVRFNGLDPNGYSKLGFCAEFFD